MNKLSSFLLKVFSMATVLATVAVMAAGAAFADVIDDLESGTGQNKYGGVWYCYAESNIGYAPVIENAVPPSEFGNGKNMAIEPYWGGYSGNYSAAMVFTGLEYVSGNSSNYSFVDIGTILTGIPGDAIGSGFNSATSFTFWAKASRNMTVTFRVLTIENSADTHDDGTTIPSDLTMLRTYNTYEVDMSISTSWIKKTVNIANVTPPNPGAAVPENVTWKAGDLMQQPYWGRQFAFNKSRITHISWLIRGEKNPGVTSGTFQVDDITVDGYTLPTYNVTFNANGGTVTPTSATTGNGKRLASLPTPTRAGYTFKGWFTTATGNTAVTESTVFSANATIYAQWTLITYKITFDANGGTVTSASGETIEGYTLASLPVPTRAGYAFNGWFTVVSGGTAVTESTVFSANTTIYAQWTPAYTVTFNAGSGTVNPASATTGEGGKLASLPIPSRVGYAFDGWFTATVGGTAVTENTVFTANVTIYAQWTTITYTITFDANGGTVTLGYENVGSTGTLAVLPPPPVRAGYNFNGWFTAKTGGEEVTTSTVFSADATIYARWTLITYTITFNANNGTVTPAFGTTGEGGMLALLPTPTKMGYVFDGWFTATVGGTAVIGSTVFSGNATIYAQWTLITYTVTFDADDGTVTPASGETVEGYTLASLPVPAKAGYVFIGWFTAKTGGEPITTSTVFSADATIYARWTMTSSVLTPDRVIPQPKANEEATVIVPSVVLAGEFTAGPNPVLKQSGIVNFFRQGKRVSNSELRIYDVSGNVINKVKINDKALGSQARRQVGSWDLCDKNGRIVSEGTYVVKGVVKTSDGKSEKVSVIVGVR
jgi:uncharacterized repeat protein (TIGR02543 family)